MLARAALTCTLVALLAGCSGGDGGAEETEAVSALSFAELVAAEIRHAGLEAEPGSDPAVLVRDGPNRLEVDLAGDFARQEEDPGDLAAIVAGAAADAVERVEGGLAGTALDEVRDDVMPLLQGRFAVRAYGFEPAETPFPGNLAVVYAVDRDESFLVVTPEDVSRWGTTVEELHELALGNLLRQTNEEEPLLCEPSGDRSLCGWASGDGYDATRMIVPELRAQIVKEYDGPAVHAVPLQNVYVALPLDLFRGTREEGFRLTVARQFQTGDEPVSSDVFVERGGELAVSR